MNFPEDKFAFVRTLYQRMYVQMLRNVTISQENLSVLHAIYQMSETAETLLKVSFNPVNDFVFCRLGK